MRVGYNALHLVPGETGGLEIYARRLLPAVARARPELDIVVFASREGAPSLAGEFEVVEVPVNARSRPRRVLAEQTLLTAAVRQARIDLLHNLFNTASATVTVPQVTSIHDLIHERVDGVGSSRALSLLARLAARRSRRILSVSEASKRDIVELLGVDPERVDVAPNGPGFPPHPDPVPEPELRSHFGLGAAPLVLTASAKLPHKNLARLIDAMASVDAVLLVPGYRTELEAELERRAGDRVRFTGWVDEATLEGLYRMASGFVFPSLAEGFGMPVLEAMARGVPVACSDATSLPEVAGDAALLFDPYDTDAIATAVRRLLDGGGSLRERGLDRARLFSWERAADATLASYDRALAGR